MFKSLFENVKKPKDNFGGKFMVRGMNSGHEKLATWGRSFLTTGPNDHVLDIGCGGGRNVQFFLTQASYVVGLDYSAMSVKVSTQLNQAAINDGRCQIIEGNVASLPFEDESMDVVTAFETVYFWPDIQTSLRQVHRVLRPGGQFLICNEADGPQHPAVKRWSKMLNFPVYTPEQLTQWLESIGFSVTCHVNQKHNLTVLSHKL